MRNFLVLLFGVLVASSASAEVESCKESTECVPQGLEVTLFGTIMAPKTEDYDAVRKAIGSFVADVRVRKYVLTALGIEGGFVVCLEALTHESYHVMVQELTSIEVDEKETSYTVKHVETCAD